MQSVFEKLTPDHVRLSPFPHAVIEDALPNDICQKLIATRPAISPPPTLEGNRIAYPAWMLRTIGGYDPVWAHFAERHIRPDILKTVRSAFGAFWHAHLPEPPHNDAAYGTLWQDSHETHNILCDARLELISPNPSAATSHRQQHLDAGNRLFSALYYLRGPEDDSEGGGLSLFRYRESVPEDLSVFEFDSSTVETVVTIPYKANTLVVFPNCAEAIHGSEVRQPTTHDRSYVFITAEVAKDLF